MKYVVSKPRDSALVLIGSVGGSLSIASTCSPNSKKSNAAYSATLLKNMPTFAGIFESIRGSRMMIYSALIISMTLFRPKPKAKFAPMMATVTVLESSDDEFIFS